MRVLIFVIVTIAAASAGIIQFDQDTNLLDSEWESYKKVFNKNYFTQTHEAVRRLQWEENLRYIQKHNFEADMGTHSYRLGMNEYGDLSNQEYREMLLGFKMNRTRSSTGSTFLSPANVKALGEVDWRNKGYVTPVKNQGACGSCWAFSTTGSLEGQHFKQTGKMVSLSEQNIVDCDSKSHGCQGGSVDSGFRYIKENGGIDTEESYPYKAKNGKCHFKKHFVGAIVTGHVDTPFGDEEALKEAVASIGPISVAIDASHKSFQLYRSGVYDEPKCSSISLDHAVLVVGYGTSTEGKAYWIVKNSWGTSWGAKGYVMMSRNKKNQCGIATAASYPLV